MKAHDVGLSQDSMLTPISITLSIWIVYVSRKIIPLWQGSHQESPLQFEDLTEPDFCCMILELGLTL